MLTSEATKQILNEMHGKFEEGIGNHWHMTELQLTRHRSVKLPFDLIF